MYSCTSKGKRIHLLHTTLFFSITSGPLLIRNETVNIVRNTVYLILNTTVNRIFSMLDIAVNWPIFNRTVRPQSQKNRQRKKTHSAPMPEEQDGSPAQPDLPP